MTEAVVTTVDRITRSAGEALGELGLASLTIGVVAERAGVSTALVHYHFDTKARLLVAAARFLAGQRADRRVAALRPRGLPALDALWASLEQSVGDGSARAWVELLLCSRGDADLITVLGEARAAGLRELQRRLPVLLRELGAAPHEAADETSAALDAELDGLLIALLAGQPAAVVRTAYDAFWLSLLASGQSRRR